MNNNAIILDQETTINRLEAENAAWRAAAGLVLTESNGIFDNEWRRPDGSAAPEYPIASFCEAIKALDALYSKTTHSTFTSERK